MAAQDSRLVSPGRVRGVLCHTSTPSRSIHTLLAMEAIVPTPHFCHLQSLNHSPRDGSSYLFGVSKNANAETRAPCALMYCHMAADANVTHHNPSPASQECQRSRQSSESFEVQTSWRVTECALFMMRLVMLSFPAKRFPSPRSLAACTSRYCCRPWRSSKRYVTT